MNRPGFFGLEFAIRDPDCEQHFYLEASRRAESLRARVAWNDFERGTIVPLSS